MKKPVTQFDLAAAFKALDEIEYDVVESNPVKNSQKLNEALLRETCEKITSRKLNIERLVEDYYDIDDNDDLELAANTRDAEIAKAKLSRIEKIVDLDAKTADDLLPSYVGKIIVRCPQCMNMFYKNEEDIAKDEEDPTICNINEPCQHCGNISGYEIIGKVDKLSDAEQAELNGEEATEEEAELEPVDETTEEEASTEETSETEEETNEETEEEAGEEDNLDLDLDLDNEGANESLNTSKNKSENETKNESENKTLNEDTNSVLAKFAASLDDFDEDDDEKPAEEALHEDVTSLLKAFEASLDSMDDSEADVEESINTSENNPEIDQDVKSENASINECGENCEGAECQASEKEPKAEDKPLDEAVAITIGVEEVDDTVVDNSPAETMIIAEPEATAVYDQPTDTLEPEITPDTEVEVAAVEPDEEVGADEPVDVEDEAGDEEAEDEVETEEEADEDEEAKESLSEGVFDSIKNKVTKAYDKINDGFEKFKFKITKKDGSIEEQTPKASDFKAVRDEAINISKTLGVKYVKIFATSKYDNKEAIIDAYVDGKQPESAGAVFKKVLNAAKATAKLGSGVDMNADDKPANKPATEPATEPTNNEVTAKAEAETSSNTSVDKVKAALSTLKTVKGEPYSSKTIDKIIDALKTGGIITESLNEDTNAAEENASLNAATSNALNQIDQWLDDTNKIIAANEANNNKQELLADNSSDAEQADTVEAVFQDNGVFGDEAETTDTKESLDEANEVSDAEFDQMINSKVFNDFNEEINIDELEDIDEESVNECTTNYLKEVYSNIDKFELTNADINNGVLVLEGLIKFHSGNTRTTTFGYNLATGKNSTFTGINEDLAKNGKFNIKCSLNNNSLVVESLSYKYEVNGQLVEGLVHKN